MRSEEIYYLDTSALVKRYVYEPGSDIIDELFSNVYRGIGVVSLSYWNLVEATIVFDKYERRLGINARKVLREMLREMKTLAKTT